MIKRINTLKKIGRFTELLCGRGSESDFDKLNVIYASNASGKSTLCDVFRSMTTGNSAYILGRKRLDAVGDPEIVVALAGDESRQTIRFQNGAWQAGTPCPRIHIYDDRFVADNVLIGHHINVDQRRNLYGLVIGDRAVALQQSVDDTEQNLSEATTAVSLATANLNRLLPEDRTIDAFRNVPVVAEIDQQIHVASEALSLATQMKSKANAIRQRSNLGTISIAEVPPSLTGVLETTLEESSLAAEQKIRDHLAATSNGLTTDWLGQGYRAQTSTACPHCAQEMQGLDLLEAYRVFFSGELQAQEQLRNSVKISTNTAFGENAQNRLRETLTAHDTERTWWQDAAGYRFELPALRDKENFTDAMEAAHRAITETLARKQANPGHAVCLAQTETATLENWATISAELGTYNDGIGTLNHTLEQRKAEAGIIDLTPLQQTLNNLQESKKRHKQPVINAYAAYDEALRVRAEAQQAKQRANNALREESNQLLENFGTKINELLELFAADFRIASDGVNFRGGQPSGQLGIELLGARIACAPSDAADPALPSLANTLSGGDRSALALAFFLAKVELDPELANCIVVFDDPYHNQDRSRQRRTIERIHRIAAMAKQSFVFSHDLDFARAVTPVHGVNVRTFAIDSLTERTTIEAKELPMLPSRAYEAKYSMLTSFIAAPGGHSHQLSSLACALRTILEEYLKLKFPLRWAEGEDWFGSMIGKIRDATGDDPLVCCQNLVTDMTEVNEYSQRFHHRTTGVTADVPDPRELVTYAKQTLSIIHQ